MQRVHQKLRGIIGKRRKDNVTEKTYAENIKVISCQTEQTMQFSIHLRYMYTGSQCLCEAQEMMKTRTIRIFSCVLTDCLHCDSRT